jgi:hypothetical protein
MPGASLGVKIAVLVIVFVLIVLLVLASVYVWQKLRRKEEVFGLMRGSSHATTLPLTSKVPLPQSDREATGEDRNVHRGGTC